ncbi:RNA polymerase subunit sigma-24, partial [Candidatus Poribacteria bacterium]|nr:RNA polymerase subunit sigma-24 [Candidatus Poribacteria bacterium]
MDIRALVKSATASETADERLAAFGQIVVEFQDMAYGLAYGALRDSHAAEDVAQEAFIEAWRSLPALREPKAFPGWFRRIVLKYCDRLT